MIITSTVLMFLYTSYSANIVALLQSPSTRIKTLKDLYESRLKIGVDDTVFNRYYFAVRLINIDSFQSDQRKYTFYYLIFQHADEPLRRKIYLKKVLRANGQDNFMNAEEGVRRIRQVRIIKNEYHNFKLCITYCTMIMIRGSLHFTWNSQSDIS